MAEIYDVIEEQGELEVVEQAIAKQEPEQKQPEENFDDILPSKFKGKTAKELAKIVADQDSMIGRQAQEVGDVRRLADELLKSQLKPVEKEKPKEVDIFENPQEAMRQAIENNPKVIAAEQYGLQAQRDMAKRVLVQKHPDYGQVVQDNEFRNWVNASKVRTQLYAHAENYDVDAADELLSTFKQLKTVKQQQVTQAVSETEKAAREKSLQAGAVDTGGSGESSKKMYSRVKLLEMQLRRPDEYAALADSGELAKAYFEKRVK